RFNSKRKEGFGKKWFYCFNGLHCESFFFILRFSIKQYYLFILQVSSFSMNSIEEFAMESSKICPNGHRYLSELKECPFCPKYPLNAPTMVDSPSAPQSPAVPPSEISGKTQIVPPPSASPAGPVAQGKTVIMPPESSDPFASKSGAVPQKEAKLVGWLVTFTWNPSGEDFKLREGKMSIGRDADNDIVLPDVLVSGKHAQIRFQNGQLKIKDNFSTNGTYVNGVDISDTAFLLHDKDEIKIGNTILQVHLI
ncbi:MAG: FHA domain-containing protein, partial [bacterium]|nr:FHA domain-containing protein [bacterium]